MNSINQQRNYFHSFRFHYGLLDDGTIWIRPYRNSLFNVNNLTLKVILELDSGGDVNFITKKYRLSREEVSEILKKFMRMGAIVSSGKGKITRVIDTNDISLIPIICCLIIMGIIQGDYFRLYASTFFMRSGLDALLIGVFALIAVIFHEIGHYYIFKKYLYFKPKFGFTFLFIFPAVYVDTHPAWTLPRNKRLMVSASGCISDLIINTLAVTLVLLEPGLEYYVTPFLIAQYTRWSIVLNPLFSGDGYWILTDVFRVVNLTKKSFRNLFRLRFNLYSFFGLLSLFMMLSSATGFAWYLFNIFRGIITRIRFV